MSINYKAVVVGCGRVGATFEMDSALPKPASHAAALKANPRIELVALCDPDAVQLKKATDYYNVPGYNEPRACLEELKPDIVVISTPPETHEELLTLTLKLKMPAVVCEKPVSDSIESARRMIAVAKNSASIVIVNHQRRFFPLFKQLREGIRTGELGRIQQVTCYYTNGLKNNGTHTIDALQHLLGEAPTWAIGVENKANNAAVGGPNVDGLLGFPGGAVAALQSCDNDSYILHDFALYGTKGAAFVRNYGFRFERVSATVEGLRELDWSTLTPAIDKRSMMAGTTAHIIGCLDGTALPESTLEDGYRVMQALEALAQSAAEGGKKISIE